MNKTTILPDGYNGHTERFYTASLETDGHLVKLACAAPGKEYTIRWARKSDIKKALKEQS